MKSLLVFILLFSSPVFAKSFNEKSSKFPMIKSYQMSGDRGLLYVVLTDVTHISDYPMTLHFHSNCKKNKESWKKVESIDIHRFCDVDFEKTKINKKGTVLSVYAKKTDLDDLNSPNRSDDAAPKCLKAEWVHVELEDYCQKD